MNRRLCSNTGKSDHLIRYMFFKKRRKVAFYKCYGKVQHSRSQWPRSLRRRSAAACLLRLGV